MTITKNGHPLSSGYKDCNTTITTLLGMGYDTFVLTHFITSKTVGHITENLSNPNLFNDILQIAQLKDLDKKFLELSKELKQETTSVQRELNTIESLAETLKLSQRFDVPSLTAELSALKAERLQQTLLLADEEKTYT